MGPSKTCAAFAFASNPSNSPTCSMSSTSHVAARPAPHGKQAAGSELKRFVPLTPLGPSENYCWHVLIKEYAYAWYAQPIDVGSMPVILPCNQLHQSQSQDIPARRLIFSAVVSFSMTGSMSKTISKVM